MGLVCRSGKWVALALSLFTQTAFAASGAVSTTLSAPSPLPNSPNSSEQMSTVPKPKPLDGVQMEAVENYINPKTNEVTLGISVYPFDSYFYGLSINGGYEVHFDRNWAWEIINAQYFFSFQKDLTTELADRYAVSPQSINTLTAIITSNVEYVHTYGKFVLLEDYIRYFRSAVFLGAGDIKTSLNNSISAGFGAKFEIFTGENFSWKVEIRDNLAFSTANNYLTFGIGTGFGF